MKDDVSTLKSLGSAGPTEYKDVVDPSLLESFPNKTPGRKYEVVLETKEHTSLCPKTGQPDFGTITIKYIPDALCIESKSLKLYLFSYRNEGAFMETQVNMMLTHLVECVKPYSMTVIGRFAPRGGIEIVVTSTYVRDDNQLVE